MRPILIAGHDEETINFMTVGIQKASLFHDMFISSSYLKCMITVANGKEEVRIMWGLLLVQLFVLGFLVHYIAAREANHS